MRLFIVTLMAVALVASAAAPQVKAGYGGADGALAQRCCQGALAHRFFRGGGCLRHQANCDCECYTVMKTMTRTVYENITETSQKVVMQTVVDRQTVPDVKRVSEICYRQEQFNYQRPVYETVTSEVPYTVNRPVCETKTREVSCVRYVPSYETRTQSVPYTVCQPVHESGMRTISYAVPRKECYTTTVPVCSGHWETQIIECPPPCDPKGVEQKAAQKGEPCEPRKICKRVWVPCTEYKEVTCSRIVYDYRTMEVPYTTCHMVTETRTREVQYTVCRNVPVTETRTVEYPVVRMVSEQHMRPVSRTVTRMIPEVGTRTVPYSVTREIPITREVCTPRQVPRTVCLTTTRCVPRTECYQVPVRICVPRANVCDPKGKGKADMDSEKAIEGPAPPEATKEKDAEQSATYAPTTRVFQTASHEEATKDSAAVQFTAGVEHYRNGRYQEAAEQFRAAQKTASSNAKYAYYYAAALYRAGQESEAQQALALAVAAEKQASIANWGIAMERIQGTTRIWLEQGRSTLSN